MNVNRFLFLECAEFNDVVFILDSSGSVGEDNFELVKEFVHKLFNESLSIAPDLVRVGLMTFSSVSHVRYSATGGYNHCR